MDQALLVGINAYPGSPLRGCVNDIVDMGNFLVSNCKFARADIRLLADGRATKAAIIERLGWLLNGVNPGDRVVFHYSGHGAQMATRNPQGEVDGMDEVICPVDFDWTDQHAIRDKDFNRIFSSVPTGVKFVWISDSCHSGDLTRDLHDPKANRRDKTLYPPADIAWRNQVARDSGFKFKGLHKTAADLNLAFISGCRSDQTSSDAVFGGRPNGALTYYLLKVLNTSSGKKDPLTKVVVNVRSDLRTNGYSQEPQLEGSSIYQQKPLFA